MIEAGLQKGTVGDAGGTRHEGKGVIMADKQLESEVDLLRQAVTLLQSRYERSSAYTDLSPTAVSDLSNAMEAVAVAEEDELGGVDRKEAVALAHRLVDDDHPELSPMWPSRTG